MVRVNNAIQGHPESPRLWEKHIDRILKDIGMSPTTHEPCLYHGMVNNQRVLFSRKVDDFAVASSSEETVQQLLDSINVAMRIPIKSLGVVSRFNGNDVIRSKYYVKLTQKKHLTKMLQSHGWLTPAALKSPPPLPYDLKWIHQLENNPRPQTTVEQQALKQKMGFSYRQVFGEVIYPVMMCRPDICFHAAKLSQYMENPAEIYYLALRTLCQYLAATLDDGIYYWWDKPRDDLPEEPFPKLHSDNYKMEFHIENQFQE